MDLSNSLIGLIRTFSPAVVGALVSWLVTLGIELPEGFEVQLAGLLFALATAAYWALVTAATRRWPAVGWLLGHPAQPTYVTRTVAVEVTPGMTRGDYRDATGL